MPRCPVCDASRVVIMIGEHRRGLCPSCGARWIQDGDVQRRVRPSLPEEPGQAQPTGAR